MLRPHYYISNCISTQQLRRYPVRQLMTERSPLTVEVVAVPRLRSVRCGQVASALAHLHSQRPMVLHRDIKQVGTKCQGRVRACEGQGRVGISHGGDRDVDSSLLLWLCEPGSFTPKTRVAVQKGHPLLRSCVEAHHYVSNSATAIFTAVSYYMTTVPRKTSCYAGARAGLWRPCYPTLGCTWWVTSAGCGLECVHLRECRRDAVEYDPS